jgi:hypothetical protein
MPIKAREYVSVEGIGDLTKLHAIMAEIAAVIRERFRSHLIGERRATFSCRIMLSEQEVKDDCRSADEFRQFTDGMYPVLWMNLTFDPEKVAVEEIQELEALFSLRLLGEITSDAPFI